MNKRDKLVHSVTYGPGAWGGFFMFINSFSIAFYRGSLFNTLKDLVEIPLIYPWLSVNKREALLGGWGLDIPYPINSWPLHFQHHDVRYHRISCSTIPYPVNVSQKYPLSL